MGIETAIQWADHSWNPWQGCTKVSAGCANCYMYREKQRYGQAPALVHMSSNATFNLPLSKKVKAGERVFTCSWSDWFHAEADAWRPEAWEIIRQRPDVNFLIVTKRTERILECLPPDWDDGWPNVWLIFTAENQEMLEERWYQAAQVPAAVLGVSIEPMLGPVRLDQIEEDELGTSVNALTGIYGGNNTACPRLDWVICGGESGPNARPCALEWIRDVVTKCKAASVPVFVKQLGSHVVSEERRLEERGDDAIALDCHKDGWAWRAVTKHSKGAEMGEWPEDLQVRELPEVMG